MSGVGKSEICSDTMIDGDTFPLWHFICIIYALMMYTLEFIRHMWRSPDVNHPTVLLSVNEISLFLVC